MTDLCPPALLVYSVTELLIQVYIDIAFTMGAYGQLVEESMKHEDEIPVY